MCTLIFYFCLKRSQLFCHRNRVENKIFNFAHLYNIMIKIVQNIDVKNFFRQENQLIAILTLFCLKKLMNAILLIILL